MLIAVSTVNDLLLSMFQLVTQHIIYETDGVMFVLSFGFDRFVSDYTHLIISGLNYHIILHTFFLQLPIHHYRYMVMTGDTKPKFRILFKNILLSNLCSGIVCCFYTRAVYEGEKVDTTQLIASLSPIWRNSDGSNNIVSTVFWVKYNYFTV